ncbi:MAG: type II CAAX prenyl endopeptidase Rce1 family protein [Tepidisphaerales bacterium]
MSRIASSRHAHLAGARGQWVRALQDYFYESSKPLTSLIFLAIPLLLYELGTGWLLTDTEEKTEIRVLAFNYLRGFLCFFGATAHYLPALAVVGILLAWHMARRDPWRVWPSTIITMACESTLLAIPLLVLSVALARYLPLAATDGVAARGVVLAFGAGIYEELIFRLAGLTLLNIVLVDLLRVKRPLAMGLMILVSAVAFSGYHYLSPAAPSVRPAAFLFRAVAGGYFAILFIYRGFGVTSGCHIVYDSYCFVLRSLLGL